MLGGDLPAGPSPGGPPQAVTPTLTSSGGSGRGCPRRARQAQPAGSWICGSRWRRGAGRSRRVYGPSWWASLADSGVRLGQLTRRAGPSQLRLGLHLLGDGQDWSGPRPDRCPTPPPATGRPSGDQPGPTAGTRSPAGRPWPYQWHTAALPGRTARSNGRRHHRKSTPHRGPRPRPPSVSTISPAPLGADDMTIHQSLRRGCDNNPVGGDPNQPIRSWQGGVVVESPSFLLKSSGEHGGVATCRQPVRIDWICLIVKSGTVAVVLKAVSCPDAAPSLHVAVQTSWTVTVTIPTLS